MTLRESFSSLFPKTIVSRVLSLTIFTGSHLQPPPLRVLEVHINDIRGIYFHITESKIHISYLRNYDLTLILSSIIFTCHPFQPLSISLLRVGSTFSISSPFDITKLQKNCLDVSSTGSLPFPMSVEMQILIPYLPYWNGDSIWI